MDISVTAAGSGSEISQTMKRKFTRELLDEILQRDGATLVGEYSGGGRRTILRYRCKCGNEREKTFCLVARSGANCSDCVYKKQCEILAKGRSVEGLSKRIEAQRNPDRDGYYTMKTLNLCIQQSGAILEGTYPTLVNTTDINFLCSCGNKCSRRFAKIAGSTMDQRENPRGAYCDECISKRMIEKRNDTNMKRYGKLGGINQENSKEKTIQTCLNKYGVPSSNQSDSVKKKKEEASMQKYGVSNPAQSEEVMERTQRNAKKYKKYQMPSGEIRNVQGYEPFAIRDLLKMYSEHQIKTDRGKGVPTIPYELNGKRTNYFPDIFIPHENRIIEVKSPRTYDLGWNDIKEKKQKLRLQKAATEALGYTYEIWCYNGKGERVELPTKQN